MKKTTKIIFLLFGLIIIHISGKAQQNYYQTNSPFENKNIYTASSNLTHYLVGTSLYSENKFTSKTIEENIHKVKWPLSKYSFPSRQQQQNFHAFLSAGVFGTTNQNVPFWMRSMHYGSVPSDGISASLIFGLSKEYEKKSNPKLIDWGGGFEGRINAGNNSKLMLIEAYAKIRISIFELKGGRFREQIGLVDSTLSSGAFSLSGNALGIPKIEVGIPDFWNIPFTNGVIAIKGNIAHGWMDTQRLNKNENNTVLVPRVDAYLHQLSAYGRIGKPGWKAKFYGGINHMAVWGHEKNIFSDWGLSTIETFKYVTIGKRYGTNTIPTSKVGNHIGSIDQAMEIKIGRTLVSGYHQFFYDVGALAKFANVKDGLWGISLKNEVTKSTNFYWNKILFEFLYSRSQGGELDSKPRTSGAENYYNNFLYLNGWSYKGDNLGNPLFTTHKYLKDGYPVVENQYFPNNRIIGYHGGTEFKLYKFYNKILLTYTLNYGTYLTSSGERGLGDTIYHYAPPYFPKLEQFSAYFESCRKLKNDFELSIQLAFDQGKLLNNSVGAGICLTKRW